MKLKIDGKIYNLKRFKKKFKNYSIGKYPASTLQTYKSRAKGTTKTFHKYLRRYLQNPLYMRNVFFYMFGSLYRACLGLKATWNTTEEKKQVEILSDYLSKLERADRYWVRPYVLLKKVTVYGLRWKDNAVKPAILAEDSFNQTNKFELPELSIMWIRLHDEDEKYPHVDIEFQSPEDKQEYILSLGKNTFDKIIKPHLAQVKSRGKYLQVGLKPEFKDIIR